MTLALTDKELQFLRGKSINGELTSKEIDSLFFHINELEAALDDADDFDALGTEGWRHYIGIE